MLDAELAEIVDNLRAIGADITDVEVKKAQGGLPKSLRETLSGFANTRGGVIILGLDEAQGFAAAGLPDPARLAADLGSMCSEDFRRWLKIMRDEGLVEAVGGSPRSVHVRYRRLRR